MNLSDGSEKEWISVNMPRTEVKAKAKDGSPRRKVRMRNANGRSDSEDSARKVL